MKANSVAPPAPAGPAVPAGRAVPPRSRAPIRWYRTPIEPEVLRELQARSDLLGGLQSLGYLGLLALTGGLAFYSCGRAPWWATVLLTYVHGTLFAFHINAVHELCHGTVFRTPELNDLFKRIFAFLAWMNFDVFARTHARHHQFTLHPPDDTEIALPIRITLRQFLLKAFLNPTYGDGIWSIGEAVRHARGRFRGAAELTVFPDSDPDRRRRAVSWARTLLIGHAAIVTASIVAAQAVHPRFLMIPVLTTFALWYGSGLFLLCNSTQHIGLRDKVADFRLCSRTIRLHPVLGFLYWHMNFHIEHHMYTQVPCYRLGRLHRLIRHDLPPSPRGLVATWREIAAIQARQAGDPGYQFEAPCPPHASAAPTPAGR